MQLDVVEKSPCQTIRRQRVDVNKVISRRYLASEGSSDEKFMLQSITRITPRADFFVSSLTSLV